MRVLASICFLMLSANALFAASMEGEQDKEEAIRKTRSAFVDAFNSKDSEALIGFWMPDGVYSNQTTGTELVGTTAIAEQFESLFSSESAVKLEVEVQSIQFVSPSVAVEHGLAKYTSDGSAPSEVDYSAVYVKNGDQWRLDRVADTPKPIVRSHYEELKQLEWMIGNWVDEDDSVSITTECSWTKNKNFITRSFSVSIDGVIELSGMQFIGWDAVNNEIRSWTFDSDGGHSHGKWSTDGDRWFVRKTGSTADGEVATAVNIITMVDEDTFTLQATQRTVDGRMMPNVDEVIVVRR